MLALLEDMYYELGLVDDLDIHPSTLKRFDKHFSLVLHNYSSVFLDFFSEFKKITATIRSTISVTVSVSPR